MDFVFGPNDQRRRFFRFASAGSFLSKLNAIVSNLRVARTASDGTARCMRPDRHASNTRGSMYELRHTAGVLPSRSATPLTTSTIADLNGRSALDSGSGV